MAGKGSRVWQAAARLRVSCLLLRTTCQRQRTWSHSQQILTLRYGLTQGHGRDSRVHSCGLRGEEVLRAPFGLVGAFRSQLLHVLSVGRKAARRAAPIAHAAPSAPQPSRAPWTSRWLPLTLADAHQRLPPLRSRSRPPPPLRSPEWTLRCVVPRRTPSACPSATVTAPR